MRWLGPLALLLAALPLAGCLEQGVEECEPLRGHAVVQSVSGRDAHVLLDDGEPAVLHLSAAVFLLQDGVCVMTGPDEVRVGDQVTFEVDEWAESYPMQGWPETTVIVR
jgi:hypothetical protein